MCLFIETIRIDHGRVCNLSRHNRRLNDTRAHFWPESTPLQLSDYLSSPGCGAGITGAGIVKARVVYGEKGIEDLSYSPYAVRHVHSLALMQKRRTRTAELPLCPARRMRRHSDCETRPADRHLHRQHRPFRRYPLVHAGTSPAERDQTGSLAGRRNLAGKRYQTGRLAFSTVRLFNAMIDWGELELPVRNIIP